MLLFLQQVELQLEFYGCWLFERFLSFPVLCVLRPFREVHLLVASGLNRHVEDIPVVAQGQDQPDFRLVGLAKYGLLFEKLIPVLESLKLLHLMPNGVSTLVEVPLQLQPTAFQGLLVLELVLEQGGQAVDF